MVAYCQYMLVPGSGTYKNQYLADLHCRDCINYSSACLLARHGTQAAAVTAACLLMAHIICKPPHSALKCNRYAGRQEAVAI